MQNTTHADKVAPVGDEPKDSTQTSPAADVPQQVPALTKPEKAPIVAGGEIAAIVPRTYEDAYRISVAFVKAGMVPESFLVKRNAQGKEVKAWEDGTIDEQATCARVSLGIMKGMEIGLAPVTAISTIMIINNRPCLWGDGAVALVQKSGKMEYNKDWHEGDWTKGDYVHHFEIKRRDNSEPITRSFSFGDAKKASLIGKKGPWTIGYPERMCFNRARAWALRDAASDVLMGIGIVEEVRDIETETRREQTTDTSDLDGGSGQQKETIKETINV